MGDLRKPMAVTIENEDGFVSRPRKWAKIDYLAERQNDGKFKGRLGLAPYRVHSAVECNPVGRDRRARPKNNNELRGFSGLEVRIDYLAERQNDGKFKGRSVIAPYRVHSAVECSPVGRDHRARQNINPGLHELHPQTPQIAPIDYLAEWENGPWDEELTTEEDAERRESGN